jgi:hypothetical protein
MSIPRTPIDVDEVFNVAGFAHDELLDDKWIVGITMIAHVLGRLDDVSRERKLQGLEGEVREALSDIKKIMQGGNGALQ